MQIDDQEKIVRLEVTNCSSNYDAIGSLEIGLLERTAVLYRLGKTLVKSESLKRWARNGETSRVCFNTGECRTVQNVCLFGKA